MRWIFSIMFFAALIGCTATGKMVNDFSDEIKKENNKPWTGSYMNEGEHRQVLHLRPAKSSQKDTASVRNGSSLWDQLAAYNPQGQILPEVSPTAIIQLSFSDKRILTVTAFQGKIPMSQFSIPVKGKDNYLILENKNQVIPIPIVYFKIKEETTILARLKNGHVGIATYSGDSLWILFMAASKESNFTYEYAAAHVR